jgi:hypothetical protein
MLASFRRIRTRKSLPVFAQEEIFDSRVPLLGVIQT